MIQIRYWILSLPAFMVLPAMAQTLMQGGGVQVTADEIRAEVQRLPAEARKNLQSPQALSANVSNIYARRVLAQQATNAGLDKNILVQQAITRATERILSDAMLEKIDQDNQPTLQAIEAYAEASYKANPKRFEQAETVRARHILIRTAEPDARAKIEVIAKELKAGASFEELAKTRSQDPGSASKGGDLGYFGRGRMVKPFEDTAFGLTQAGAVSEVFESPFGFHIMQLVDRKPAGTVPFTEVKDVLMREAQNEILNKARLDARDKIVMQANMDESAIVELAKSLALTDATANSNVPAQASPRPAVR